MHPTATAPCTSPEPSHLIPHPRIHHPHPPPEPPHRHIPQLIRLQEARPPPRIAHRARRQRDHPRPLFVMLAGDLRDARGAVPYRQHQTRPVLRSRPVLVRNLGPPDLTRPRRALRPAPGPLGPSRRARPTPRAPTRTPVTAPEPAPPVGNRGNERQQYDRAERRPPGHVHAPTVPAPRRPAPRNRFHRTGDRAGEFAHNGRPWRSDQVFGALRSTNRTNPPRSHVSEVHAP